MRLHGGTLEVDSCVAEESEDGSHGSTFSVILKLGRDHLPRSMVDEKPADLPSSTNYGRSVVEEANHWGSSGNNTEDLINTPSDSSDSGGSSEGSRLDPSVLFFSKTDVIMIGRSQLFSINDFRSHSHNLKWTTTQRCDG